MPNVKRKASARAGTRAKASATKSMLTTAFMVDAGASLPQGASGFTFKASNRAAEVLTGKPQTVKPLLQGYGQALAKSRKSGRAVSFRVDVEPDGGATVTPVEDQVSATEAFPVEKPGKPTPELRAALESAREKGRLRAGEILAGEDMLNAEAFAKLLGTTRVTVNTKRQSGQLLGLDGARRGFRFPMWQLDNEGRPYGMMAELQERLGGPWALYRFLVQPHGALDGLTGREALEQGRADAALQVAEGIAQGDFR